jgi:hypothetical protein
MKKLDDISKKNNFQTPDGYFDSLNKEIKTKIENEDQNRPRSGFEIFKPYIYMAASLILLVSLLKFALNVLVDKDPIIKPNIETTADIDFNENLYEIYDDDIVFYEYMEEENDMYAENDISDEDIENYLCQYYLEYELLYE